MNKVTTGLFSASPFSLALTSSIHMAFLNTSPLSPSRTRSAVGVVAGVGVTARSLLLPRDALPAKGVSTEVLKRTILPELELGVGARRVFGKGRGAGWA